jgi:polyphosphate kinase
MVRQEIENQATFGNGRIIAKMNALDDLTMIQELYKASAAGVQIDLIVRGHCRLRPGLPGFSENIRLISILGRFLEHSRVFYFRNNNDHRVFIGSGDWQRRNLDDRVEATLEVEDPTARQRLIDTLEMALTDHRSAWDLGSDGQYTLRAPADAAQPDYQERLMALSLKGGRESSWDIT